MSLETKAKNDGTLQSTESEPTSISRKVSDEKNTNNNNKNGKEKEKSTYSLFSRGKKQNIASIPFGIGKQLYIISSGVQSNKESKPKTVYAKIGNVDSIRRIWKATLEEGELEKLNLTKKEIERQEIMYETILTEADYLRDLKIIQDVFETPLREERIVLPEQANIMFMNLESLELSERQEAEHPLVSGIGDILSRYWAKQIDEHDRGVNDLKPKVSRVYKGMPISTRISRNARKFVYATSISTPAKVSTVAI
ncbi:RHO1 GDP-GTP exchange protein 2 [Zancudomyces culisetae]|uniref:RHO1 GDP-GTP exchange protein 2 n=1 Tax=Zancudomyces culisetae TaxID=1213189 RepID=A0A1R1PCY6_ZANCU|nr:RHO1 GDP-GTP exchange protein 2 [Zancudomyces culisetae]|eukprot:OMH78835.1 RHO1 GDP-GTP exchange protein 2 [Zancudomyces culisetae]